MNGLNGWLVCDENAKVMACFPKSNVCALHYKTLLMWMIYPFRRLNEFLVNIHPKQTQRQQTQLFLSAIMSVLNQKTKAEVVLLLQGITF